jgi:hypothetical protein
MTRLSHEEKSDYGDRDEENLQACSSVMDLLTNEQEYSSNACRAKTNKMGYEGHEFGPTYCSFIFVHILIMIVQDQIFV